MVRGADQKFPVVLFTNSMVMGGLEEHVLQLSIGLIARGFGVGVICSTYEGIRPLREALTKSGAVVHALPHRRSLLGAIPRTRTFVDILRRYRGGVLHLHFTGYKGGDLATAAAPIAGIRAVVRSVHLPPVPPITGRDRFAIRLRDRQLARVICVSEQTRREHVTALGRDPRRCTVVHNGVDLRRFSPDIEPIDVRAEFGLDRDAPIVGTVSRLGEERKGMRYFIEAAAIVAARVPAARFLIVGDGDLRPALEHQAASLGIGAKVIFAGHRADVPALLAVMRVFASPTLYEACQYNLLEAMASGLPVVTTPAGVAPEAVEDGVSGSLVPLAEPAAMAERVLALLRDPDRAHELGTRARAVVASQFSVDAMVDSISGIYREAVGPRYVIVPSEVPGVERQSA
jgi:glycosyltransferase involved in cell wall biosynthesis